MDRRSSHLDDAVGHASLIDIVSHQVVAAKSKHALPRRLYGRPLWRWEMMSPVEDYTRKARACARGKAYCIS